MASYSVAQFYGPGTYFAERSTKSDEYARGHVSEDSLPRKVKEKYYRADSESTFRPHEIKTMVLARVFPGKVLEVLSEDQRFGLQTQHCHASSQQHIWGHNDGYHSVLGHRGNSSNTFREIVAPQDGAIPEIKILYVAEYDAL